jgi:hypothetical protein
VTLLPHVPTSHRVGGLCLAFLMFTLLSSSCASERGRWLTNGMPIGDEANTKALHGFGAQLIIVDDPKAFVEMWDKPDFPHTDTLKQLRRNHQAGAFVLFAGCTPSSEGKCDVVADYNLLGPNGNVRGASSDSIVWNQLAPPKENTQRSLGALLIELGTVDPDGTYTVKAVVRDRNAKTALDLEDTFELR